MTVGNAIVTEGTIVEASSLPSHRSTQQAKLYALIQALQLSKSKKTNIYRLQVCFCYTTGLCISERRLTASEKDIKNKEEIKTLLDAAWEPERVAVIHC